MVEYRVKKICPSSLPYQITIISLQQPSSPSPSSLPHLPITYLSPSYPSHSPLYLDIFHLQSCPDTGSWPKMLTIPWPPQMLLDHWAALAVSPYTLLQSKAAIYLYYFYFDIEDSVITIWPLYWRNQTVETDFCRILLNPQVATPTSTVFCLLHGSNENLRKHLIFHLRIFRTLH